jgi:hypothetical protein
MKIALGATRLVLLTRRWAIKFPRPTGWRLFLGGLLANMQEREFARTGWPELCPVRWSIPGGWLLVMPFAEPLDDLQWSALQQTRHEDSRVPVEMKQDSFGVLRGAVVAVDYGS